MINEENLIQLSSVRDRWITEIRVKPAGVVCGGYRVIVGLVRR